MHTSMLDIDRYGAYCKAWHGSLYRRLQRLVQTVVADYLLSKHESKVRSASYIELKARTVRRVRDQSGF